MEYEYTPEETLILWMWDKWIESSVGIEKITITKVRSLFKTPNFLHSLTKDSPEFTYLKKLIGFTYTSQFMNQLITSR